MICEIAGGFMPLYQWEGRTAQGKVLKGEMEAASLEAVFARLRSQRIQLNPGLVKEKGKGLSRQINIPGLGPKVKAHDIMIFTRQFFHHD